MEGNVYVSLDEGKTFKAADGVPRGKIVMVFEHPTDNRYVSSAVGWMVLAYAFYRALLSPTVRHTTAQKTEGGHGGHSTSQCRRPR